MCYRVGLKCVILNGGGGEVIGFFEIVIYKLRFEGWEVLVKENLG